MKEERTKRILRLKNLLDVSSDIQLKMIEKEVVDLLKTEEFIKNDLKESQNFTVSESHTESSPDFDDYIGEDPDEK